MSKTRYSTGSLSHYPQEKADSDLASAGTPAPSQVLQRGNITNVSGEAKKDFGAGTEAYETLLTPGTHYYDDPSFFGIPHSNLILLIYHQNGWGGDYTSLYMRWEGPELSADGLHRDFQGET